LTANNALPPTHKHIHSTTTHALHSLQHTPTHLHTYTHTHTQCLNNNNTNSVSWQEHEDKLNKLLLMKVFDTDQNVNR